MNATVKLKASNKANQVKLEDLHLRLKIGMDKINSEITTLSEKTKDISMNPKVALTDEEKLLCDDQKKLKFLLDALSTYIKEIEYSWKGILRNNRMCDNDIRILELQATNLFKVFGSPAVASASVSPVDQKENKSPVLSEVSLLSSEDDKKKPINTLSQLIIEAGECEYKTSKKRIWMRRAMLVVTCLVAASITAAFCACLMVPGLNIGAALLLVPKVLQSVCAFIYLGNGAFMQETFKFDGMRETVNIPVFMTAWPIFAAITAFFSASKIHITTKPREVAARDLQVGTVNKLASDLTKNINALTDFVVTAEVKTFLLATVTEAIKLYNSGATSLFREAQTSKMDKARLILSETAKIIESENIPETVDDLLANAVDSFTLFDLLNSQRNSTTFWKSTSSTFDRIIKAAKENTPAAFFPKEITVGGSSDSDRKTPISFSRFAAA